MYLREHFSACSEDRNSCNKGQVQAHRALQLLQQYLNTLSKTEHYSRQPKNAVAPRGRCNFTLSNRANLFYHIPYRLQFLLLSLLSQDLCLPYQKPHKLLLTFCEKEVTKAEKQSCFPSQETRNKTIPLYIAGCILTHQLNQNGPSLYHSKSLQFSSH